MSRRRFMILAVTLVALNIFFWAASSGFALPKAIINQFFGNQMVRAEVFLTNGQDWRIDRGVVSGVTPTTVTLREADGTTVDIPVSSAVRIQGAKKIAKRMRIVVYHQANLPAELVQVER
jgi:hypothetical protein